MQDVLLPYMLSDKHYDDTWFIVLEEDWRLREADQVPGPLTYRSGSASVEEGLARRSDRLAEYASAASSSSDKGQLNLSALGDPKAPADIEFLARTSKAVTQWRPNRFVEDLVKLGIMALRREGAECLWYSWEPGKRKQHPGHGLTLFGCSVKGADALLWCCWKVKTPTHFDLMLLEWLVQKEVAAVYHFPSIGHFATHVSGCEGPASWVRESSWESIKHIMQDTRIAAGEKAYFGRFCPKGVEWSEPFASPEEEPVWRTPWFPHMGPRIRSLWEFATTERSKRQLRLFEKHIKLRHWAGNGEEAKLPDSC